MTNNDDMVLYEVLSPEKIAALISGEQNKNNPKASDIKEPPPSDAKTDSPAMEESGTDDTREAVSDTNSEELNEDSADSGETDDSPAEARDDDILQGMPENPPTRMVVDVRFQESGKTYFFDPGENEINTGDGVIVETSRGVEFGEVTQGSHSVLAAQICDTLKPVMRLATQQDRDQREKNRAKEKEAFQICARKIQEHNLDMKLVNVECAFTGAKIIFYFTADGRVDFRELVKDLAGVFKTRIELRQIGVRDEAKLLGGLGSCGRSVCCKQFLPDFQPVSIKMAKEQSLSLSPTKISGICGRLMCCLKYEQDNYETMRKRMPKIGIEVMSPEGQGTVLESNVITEKTRLRMVLPDGTIDVRWYPFDELTRTDAPRLEPAPRPPKVERLSRRERLLQDQKARKEAASKEEENAKAETAQTASTNESAAAEAPSEEGSKRKRSRRGRRHSNGPKPEGSDTVQPSETGSNNTAN